MQKVGARGSIQWWNWSTHHHQDCMHKVTLCEGSEVVHYGESSEETFREFQFGLID